MNDRRLPDAKGWYLTADHARLLRYDGYTWTAYTTDGDETELNDGYSTTADPDLLIRTLGAQDEWLDKARDLLEIARKAVSE